MALSWLMACRGCVGPNNRDSYSMHSSSLYKGNLAGANTSASSLSSADSVDVGMDERGMCVEGFEMEEHRLLSTCSAMPFSTVHI